ncbi:MAG TPA: S41 family peptidase [Pyrinomonadaceae bacterium]|nr:S41 family peptidase [Pyrinomonadaceae bacterium]
MKTGNQMALLAGTICSLALFLSFQGPRAFSSSEVCCSTVSTDTREGRLAVFDSVWETIEDRYYDPTFRGIDWKAPGIAYRQAAADAKGGHELYQVLRRMLAALDDPHTRVYPPEQKFDWWKPRFVSAGLVVRQIEGVPTVVQVDPKSDPAGAGIRAGDQIESVDGVPAWEAVQKKLGSQELANASKAARFHAVATLLEGEAGGPVRIKWKRKDGQIKAGTFPRYWAQRELGFQISRKHNFLVIEIEGFTQGLVIELLRTLREKLRGARGVVLDLRRNGGGDADAMAEMAELFLGEGIDLGDFTDRAGTTLPLITHAKSAFHYAPNTKEWLPLVVLVSERTSSAAEILAAALQIQHRARVIGTPTCGCVLAIRSRYTLPDDGVLDVSEFDYRTAGGIRLEGRGVQPDAVILPQRRDLYAKQDRMLDVALDILNTSRRTF